MDRKKFKCTIDEAYTYEIENPTDPIIRKVGLSTSPKSEPPLREAQLVPAKTLYMAAGGRDVIAHVPDFHAERFDKYLSSMRSGEVKTRSKKEELSEAMQSCLCRCEKEGVKPIEEKPKGEKEEVKPAKTRKEGRKPKSDGKTHSEGPYKPPNAP